ncbi:MAG: hypothetical protein II453_02365 [Alphaproteobacteria bacterium]|nr:hypothetical protein [Alphaproteobacteria bacterium]
MIGFNKTFGIALMAVCLPTHCFSESINSNIDFISLSHEIGWRAWASWFRNAKDNDLIPVLKKSYFDDSIFQIIAKGISDCVCRKGVFSDENRKVNIKERLVFVDFNADPKSFKQEEWNVVLLYNYLDNSMHASNNEFTTYEDFYDPRIVTDAQKRLSDVKERLLKIYKDEVINNTRLVNYLNTAYRVINDYANSLRLYQYIHEYKKARKQQPGRPKFSPNTIGWSNYNETTNSGQFRLQNARIELEGKETPANLDVVVEDGKIVRYKIWDTTNKFDNDENLIGKFKTFKENFKLDKDFIDKQFKDKLLSKTQIHNLRNFGEGNIPVIVRGNCYVNSVLQALHASATVRENVQRLNKVKDKPRTLNILNISPVITDIFDAIEKGGMERYINGKDSNQNLKRYQNVMNNLANCIEQSEAYLLARTSDDVKNGSNQIQNKYTAVYSCSSPVNSSIGNGDNCRRGCHTLRKTGTYKTGDTLHEMVEALTIEAREHGIETIVPDKIKKQRQNGEIRVENREYEVPRYTILELPKNAKEFIPKEQTAQEIDDFIVLSSNTPAEPCKKKASVEPIKIALRTVEKSWQHPLRAYSEIEETVYGKKHKYKLVASVDYPEPGHFFASVLTKEGWVRIDDLAKKDYTDFQEYDEIPTQYTPWGAYRNIVIYEPVY